MSWKPVKGETVSWLTWIRSWDLFLSRTSLDYKLYFFFFFKYIFRFLMDLEHRIEESILISDVCDIVYEHAVEHFSVFILYVTNQGYQEKNYRRILWVNFIFFFSWEILPRDPHGWTIRNLCYPAFFMRKTSWKLNKTSDFLLLLPHLILLIVFKSGSGPPQMNEKLALEFNHRELL